MNVFNPDDDNNKYKDSGVQRCQILGITEDVPESNSNLHSILDRLKLESVKYSLAFDLKCANAVFGLSAHSGKRACLWCEGLITELGQLRSLGSLDYWYEEYAKAGAKKLNMQYFMNVINPRILYKDLDPSTMIQDLIPPPELHLLIGVVTLVGVALLDIWEDFDEFLNNKNVFMRGYQGRGWDGNNSNKILNCLEALEFKLNTSAPHLLPFTRCLFEFRKVKDACFGVNLDPAYKRELANFKNSFTVLQELCIELNTPISFTWKIHILFFHVEPFIDSNNQSLGKFSEQCGEAIHAKFKPTWSRYKRDSNHPEHGEKLKSAVVDFCSRRIN